MASIGLRLDHSTGGTELATMLAKAMYGDPLDRYKAANMLSEIDNRSADTAYRQALTEASQADLSAKRGGVAGIKKMVLAGQGGQFGAEPAQEAPVPVAPLPVAPAAVAPAAGPPLLPETPRPSMFGSDLPPPLPVVSAAPMPAMFGSDQPPPLPVESAAPMPAMFGSDQPVVTPVRPPMFGSDQPQPVEPDIRLTNYPMPQPPPEETWGQAFTRAIGLNRTMGVDPRGDPHIVDASLGGTVNTVPGRPLPPSTEPLPVAITPQPAAPGPTLAPQPAAAPAPLAQPAAVAAPAIEQPRPLAPAATPPPPATPEQKQIAATQPAAQVPAGQAVSHGDGTTSVGLPRGSIRLTDEEADGIATMIAFGSDPGGQTAKFAGNAGLLFNPANKLSPTETLATLSGGGSELSNTSAASAAGGPQGGGYNLKGNSLDIQDQNTIASVNQLMRDGQPVPRQLADNYQGAIDRGFGQKYDIRTDDKGNVIRVPIEHDRPMAYADPREVYQAAGINVGPASRTVPSQQGGATAAPAGATTAQPQQPPQQQLPAGADAEIALPNVGNGDIEVLVKADRKDMTDAQRKTMDYLINTHEANKTMDKWTVNDLPGRWTNMLAQAGANTSGGGFVNNLVGLLAQDQSKIADPKLQAYLTETNSFMDPLLRSRSGAAISSNDKSMIVSEFIPQPGDTQATMDLKRQKRHIAEVGLANGVYGKEPTAATITAYVNGQLQSEGILPQTAAAGGQSVPAATATAPAKSGGGFTVGSDGKLKRNK